jgi:putative ATPase
MPRQPELFARPAAAVRTGAHAPLAERMRPRTLAEFVGQRHLLAPGRVLHDMLAGGRVESLILWGPPGTGKTTLAHLLADASGARAVTFSAVLQGVKDLREIVSEAADELEQRSRRSSSSTRPSLNKAQQDAFLPHALRRGWEP